MENGIVSLYKKYLIGAVFGYSIVLLSNELLKIYSLSTGQNIDGLIFIILINIMRFIGGIIGGYIVNRSRLNNPFIIGVNTSAISYFIELVYHVVFTGFFKDSFFAIIAYLLGGISGAVYADKKQFYNYLNIKIKSLSKRLKKKDG